MKMKIKQNNGNFLLTFKQMASSLTNKITNFAVAKVFHRKFIYKYGQIYIFGQINANDDAFRQEDFHSLASSPSKSHYGIDYGVYHSL